MPLFFFSSILALFIPTQSIILKSSAPQKCCRGTSPPATSPSPSPCDVYRTRGQGITPPPSYPLPKSPSHLFPVQSQPQSYPLHTDPSPPPFQTPLRTLLTTTLRNGQTMIQDTMYKVQVTDDIPSEHLPVSVWTGRSVWSLVQEGVWVI